MQNENGQEIEKQFTSKNKVFVLFYQSWCPYSQRFLPVFTKFAENEERECIKILADFTLQLCEKYDVEVFPTVLFFENGKVSKRLDGERGIGLSQQRLDDFAKKC